MKKRWEVAFPLELKLEEAKLLSERRKHANGSRDCAPDANESATSVAAEATTRSEAEAEGEKARAQEAERLFETATGVALSGGGIRSATFALGIFQALATSGFLPKVDYLSTVSGGGYFGGFYCGLFASRTDTPPPDAATTVHEKLDSSSDQVQYLKENGRYLAPAGSDDLWVGGAVLMRNWIAVQLVLASALLLLFLSLEVGTNSVGDWATSYSSTGARGARELKALRDVIHGASSWAQDKGLWLSPLWVPPVALFVLAALPLGWSYWLSGHGSLPRYARKAWDWLVSRKLGAFILGWKPEIAHWEPAPPKIGTFIVAGLCAGAAAHLMSGGEVAAGGLIVTTTCTAFAAETIGYRAMRDQRFLARAFVAVSFAITFGLYWGAFLIARHFCAMSPLGVAALTAACFSATRGLVRYPYKHAIERMQKTAGIEGAVTLEDEDHFAHQSVSVWLAQVAVVCVGLLVLALMHTAGRTVYSYLSHDAGPLITGVGAALTTMSASARKLAVSFGAKSGGKRPEWMTSALFYVAGFTALLVVMLSLSVAAEMIVYSSPAPSTSTVVHVTRYECEESLRLSDSGPAIAADCNASVGSLAIPHEPQTSRALGWMLVLLVVSLIYGSSHLFLNSSTHLALYAARITRAFLGASNPARVGSIPDLNIDAGVLASRKAATQLMPGDDISLATYFAHPGGTESSPYTQGAPLHLINSTINETVDGRSQIQQSDRKGLSLAVGPCGMSAGVRHHSIMQWGKPNGCKATSGGAGFEVFNYPPPSYDPLFRMWARLKNAFSRSAPVRDPWDVEPCSFQGEILSLGQWLGISGAAFTTGLGFRTNAGLSLLAGLGNLRLGYWWSSNVERPISIRRAIGVFFWVHHYLRREYLARFPGTANRLWYLSDGGHFENTAAYELIRRRLPYIIVVDAEADPGYTFEGLGNLVRKARLDFGAEITLHRDASNVVRQKLLPHIGCPDDFVRDAQYGRSRAHALVATIRYADETEGLMLYIKPTLMGDEPADVQRYRSEHPDFPQESTGDQFFEEAQWESYRKLGEHIGRKLFTDALGPF